MATASGWQSKLPLVRVFTQWYQALRLAAAGQAPPAQVEAAYQDAAAVLDGGGMPGLEQGLLPLALLCLHVQHALPAQTDEHTGWGPYEPWARPLVLLARSRRSEAAQILRKVPDPPRNLLFEALWCLAARAAIAVGDRETMARAHAELTPAAAELAGAGSGLLTLGPVSQPSKTSQPPSDILGESVLPSTVLLLPFRSRLVEAAPAETLGGS